MEAEDVAHINIGLLSQDPEAQGNASYSWDRTFAMDKSISVHLSAQKEDEVRRNDLVMLFSDVSKGRSEKSILMKKKEALLKGKSIVRKRAIKPVQISSKTIGATRSVIKKFTRRLGNLPDFMGQSKPLDSIELKAPPLPSFNLSPAKHCVKKHIIPFVNTSLVLILRVMEALLEDIRNEVLMGIKLEKSRRREVTHGAEVIAKDCRRVDEDDRIARYKQVSLYHFNHPRISVFIVVFQY